MFSLLITKLLVKDTRSVRQLRKYIRKNKLVVLFGYCRKDNNRGFTVHFLAL